MPSTTFAFHHKYAPTTAKVEKSRPPLPSCNNSNSCEDKSTITCSTADMSFASSFVSSSISSSVSTAITSVRNGSAGISTTDSNASFSAFSDSSNNKNRLLNTSCQSVNTSHNNSNSNCNRSIRSLSSPVPMHSQLSLLDMTMDESHDDESSIEPTTRGTPRKFSHSHHQHKQNDNNNNYFSVESVNTSTDSSFNQSLDLGNSILSQTEKNLAAISESMTTVSFCGGGSKNREDYHGSDCGGALSISNCSENNNCKDTNDGLHEDNGGSNTSFSDTLVQNRLFDDFNYLLGSRVMPCCHEKNIFSNCLTGRSSSFTIEEENANDATDTNHGKPFSNHHNSYNNNNSSTFPSQHQPPSQIRNRAGESWRARAYRIRKLREERMINSGDNFVISNNNNSNVHASIIGMDFNPYSFSNRRQLSMERAIGKSHSLDWRNTPSHYDYLKTSSSSSTTTTDTVTCVTSSSFSSCHWNSTLSSSSGRRRRPKHEINSDPLGCIIGDCIDPIAPLKDDAVELEVVWKQEEKADLCYDSDPGETSFRKSILDDDFKKNATTDDAAARASTSKVGSTDIENSSMKHCKSLIMQKAEDTNNKIRMTRRNHYSSFDRKNKEDCHFLGGNDSFDIHVSFEQDTSRSSCHALDVDGYDDEENYDDDYEQNYDEDEDCEVSVDDQSHLLEGNNTLKFHSMKNKFYNENLTIAENVQNALNTTWTLTWHPCNKILKGQITKSAPSKVSTPTFEAPRCIRLWFERGNRIRGNNIVEPKLMWRDAYNPDLSSLRKLNDSITNGPQQVCLLSICRILEVKDYIDRTKYPFAKKSCTFFIKTCEDTEFLFETQSEKERDEIVYLWKLVVARLASQAVVGDGDKMVGEFFVPSSLGVR